MGEKILSQNPGNGMAHDAERLSLITAPKEDKTGRIIEPAIDFGTGLMPNGQPVRTFYERDGHNSEDAEWLARFAVANAAKRLLDS